VEGEVIGGRPLVLLDVDGVLNLGQFATPGQRSALERRHGWYNGRAGGDGYGSRIVMNRLWGRMLRPLAEKAELAWATGWEDDANLFIGPLLGLPELRVAPAVHGGKASTVIPWTRGRPWAWLEDIEEELEDAAALTDPGVRCCPVLVDPATGLTSGHVSQVADWLEGL
jgi:hypothetical protein